MDYLGTFFILLCVVLIALGGAGGLSGDSDEISEEQRKENNLFLGLALAFAILSGFVLSMNTVTPQPFSHSISSGLSVNHLYPPPGQHTTAGAGLLLSTGKTTRCGSFTFYTGFLP